MSQKRPREIPLERSARLAIVGERIRALRTSLPPPKGRRSRTGELSQADFAKLLGTTRELVSNWERGKQEPQERYRIMLAEISKGTWRPEDFSASDEASPNEFARLRDEVASLRQSLDLAGEAHDHLKKRVEALEEGGRRRRQAP